MLGRFSYGKCNCEDDFPAYTENRKKRKNISLLMVLLSSVLGLEFEDVNIY